MTNSPPDYCYQNVLLFTTVRTTMNSDIKNVKRPRNASEQ